MAQGLERCHHGMGLMIVIALLLSLRIHQVELEPGYWLLALDH
jgi:hypothetical protein